MSEKHYPYIGGSFDRIVFDGDGSVWVPEVENVTLGASQAADEWGEGFRAGCDAANEASRESVEHYKAENDKLKELVRAMWACISHIGEYDVFYYDMAKDGCGMSCTVNGEHCCADKLYDLMRELRVADE